MSWTYSDFTCVHVTGIHVCWMYVCLYTNLANEHRTMHGSGDTCTCICVWVTLRTYPNLPLPCFLGFVTELPGRELRAFFIILRKEQHAVLTKHQQQSLTRWTWNYRRDDGWKSFCIRCCTVPLIHVIVMPKTHTFNVHVHVHVWYIRTCIYMLMAWHTHTLYM